MRFEDCECSTLKCLHSGDKLQKFVQHWKKKYGQWRICMVMFRVELSGRFRSGKPVKTPVNKSQFYVQSRFRSWSSFIFSDIKSKVFVFTFWWNIDFFLPKTKPIHTNTYLYTPPGTSTGVHTQYHIYMRVYIYNSRAWHWKQIEKIGAKNYKRVEQQRGQYSQTWWPEQNRTAPEESIICGFHRKESDEKKNLWVWERSRLKIRRDR